MKLFPKMAQQPSPPFPLALLQCIFALRDPIYFCSLWIWVHSYVLFCGKQQKWCCNFWRCVTSAASSFANQDIHSWDSNCCVKKSKVDSCSAAWIERDRENDPTMTTKVPDLRRKPLGTLQSHLPFDYNLMRDSSWCHSEHKNHSVKPCSNFWPQDCEQIKLVLNHWALGWFVTWHSTESESIPQFAANSTERKGGFQGMLL